MQLREENALIACVSFIFKHGSHIQKLDCACQPDVMLEYPCWYRERGKESEGRLFISSF